MCEIPELDHHTCVNNKVYAVPELDCIGSIVLGDQEGIFNHYHDTLNNNKIYIRTHKYNIYIVLDGRKAHGDRIGRRYVV